MRDEKWRQFSKQVVYGAVLLIFGFLTLKVSANGVGPYTHYVNATNPTPAWPYTNWSTAAQRIQDAVNAASAGSTVLVASGVYNSGGGSGKIAD